MRHVAMLGVGVLAGCVEAGDHHIAPHLVDTVQVSRKEPGSACRPLGALDGTSGDCEGGRYESAYTSLRMRAALRGGNYVVIDAVTADTTPNSGLTINGRLYACSLGPYPTTTTSFSTTSWEER
jgi:hypothetical protein